MRGGWGEAEIVWFESGCVICRAADHAEAIGHRPQAIPVDGMFSWSSEPKLLVYFYFQFYLKPYAANTDHCHVYFPEWIQVIKLILRSYKLLV